MLRYNHLIHLAAPLDVDSPCGESLEYDAEYLALDELAQGKPEVEYGECLMLAVAADFKQVHRKALALAARSRDLRLAVHLVRAELELNGVQGLAAGLALIEALVLTQWQHVHPQLDPDEDNDPQLRVNILAGLCDASGLLLALRRTALVEVAALGRASLRDIDLVTAEAGTAVELEPLSQEVIKALFQQASPAHLEQTLAALEQAYQCSLNIEAALTERVGVAHSIDLQPLSSLLRRAADLVLRYAPPVQASLEPACASPSNGGVMQPAGGRIASRDDVRRALDELCDYFAEHEPGNPVPLLLARARKLLGLNFIELLQDLAPDGLTQLAQVSGNRDVPQA